MIGRIRVIAFNTFREAVRDRVLYNLVVFALLMVCGALVLGRISLRIERLVLVNLGLTAIALFGIVIAIFLGISLVSKEIERRTLYTVLAARPVRRWEFIHRQATGPDRHAGGERGIHERRLFCGAALFGAHIRGG